MENDAQHVRRPPLAPLIETLPAIVPFIGPDTMMRRSRRRIVLRLGANESAFGIAPEARRAMVEAVDTIAWYGDPENYALRTELAAIYSVARDEIVVGSGIDELLGLLVRAFLPPEGAAVTSLGGYPTFDYHVRGFGGVLHHIRYRDDGRNDLDGLATAARQHGARLVYLADPDNPSGTWFGPERVAAFRRDLPEGCLLLLDQAYAEFAPPEDVPTPAGDDPGVVYLRTFSKAHGMAGARIGYGITDAGTIAALEKIRLHFGVNRVAQAGALASLRATEFIAGVVAAVAEGRRDYARLGAELGLSTLPSATNFVAFDVGSRERADKLVEALWERGVFVRKPQAPPLERYVRISVGTPEERVALAEVMRQVVADL